MPLVYTDSMYCYNIFTNWMYSWAFKDWKKADNSPILNKELIETYFNLTQFSGYKIDLRWIKGHNKNKWNDLADQLATGKYKIKGD